ncbi:MAG: DUF4383 domain-containing protein [Patescibacteria group bacterium]
MAKKSALVFGIIFLIVGILGFIPNGIVGMGATFEAGTLHNVIHLIFGLVLVWVAVKSAHKAATTLKVVGIIYLILAIIGFIQDSTILGIVAVNSADNWLHLVLGIVIAALGFASKKEMAMPSSIPSSAPQM